MDLIKYPKSVDLSLYSKKKLSSDVFYGLPQKIAYCKKCVISNQRPNSAVEYNHTKSTKKTRQRDQ